MMPEVFRPSVLLRRSTFACGMPFGIPMSAICIERGAVNDGWLGMREGVRQKSDRPICGFQRVRAHAHKLCLGNTRAGRELRSGQVIKIVGGRI